MEELFHELIIMTVGWTACGLFTTWRDGRKNQSSNGYRVHLWATIPSLTESIHFINYILAYRPKQSVGLPEEDRLVMSEVDYKVYKPRKEGR